MEPIYKLNRSITASDRKYSYVKISNYLQEQEIDHFNFRVEHKKLYFQFNSKIGALNKAMFIPQADYKSIITKLEQLKLDVLEYKEIDGVLEKYLIAGILPKLAYCYYKLGFHSIAESILNLQFSITQELVREKGYFMFFDSMEQILNLSKVLLAQNKLQQCVFNWGELFKFMILGGERALPFFKGDVSWVNTGVYKILKEYSILNFLNLYITGQMQFGIYPCPTKIFCNWYTKMEVNTSERQAIFGYISLLESSRNTQFPKFVDEVVEFTQSFESRNYIVLRLSLISVLVDRLEIEKISHKKKLTLAIFLKDYLETIVVSAWLVPLMTRLENIIK